METVGEWWSILILRDAFQGSTRFDEFERNLGIAPNILSRRLAHLTKTGMFVRRRYQERPPRYEYVLTDKARDFFPVIATLLAWGNKHLAPKGESILLANRDDRRPLDPVVVDAADQAADHARQCGGDRRPRREPPDAAAAHFAQSHEPGGRAGWRLTCVVSS